VVFWTCRCDNDVGRTDDGDSYCTCPPSMTCAQLVASLGGEGPESEIAGGYCQPPDAASGDVCGGECDPKTAPCP
jgi:hypothetical protein